MTAYLLLALSILLETAKNVFSNDFSKRMLVNDTDIYKFNVFMYTGSFLVLCLFGAGSCSAFTVGTAFLFALAIWLNQYCFLKALKVGSMSFTTFIQGVALIIPLIYGAFVWKETILPRQFFLLAVLIGGMALALLGGHKQPEAITARPKNTGSGRFLLYAGGAMLFLGCICILQSTHQMSEHSDELVPFLRLAFLFTVLMNLITWCLREALWRRHSGYGEHATFSLKSGAIPMAAASGIFMGLVHMINLYLAGVLPKVIFFPVSNGGLIFVSLIAALIFFKERMSARQWVGILIGTVALSLIGL